MCGLVGSECVVWWPVSVWFAVSGCNMNPGDLLGSGTISGNPNPNGLSLATCDT